MTSIKLKSMPATLAPYLGVHASIVGSLFLFMLQIVEHFSVGGVITNLVLILLIPITYFGKLVETQTWIELYEGRLILRRPLFFREGKFFPSQEIEIFFADMQELSISWKLQGIIVTKKGNKIVLPLCVRIIEGNLPETNVKVDSKYKNGVSFMEVLSKRVNLSLGGALH